MAVTAPVEELFVAALPARMPPLLWVSTVVASAFFAVLSWPQPLTQAFRYLPCRYGGLWCVHFEVGGHCFDPRLGQLFERNFAYMEETRGAQLAVWMGEDRQCRLWGRRQGVFTDENSLQVVFSTSKVVASIAAAMLVDRGLLDYDKPIANYWPEFGWNEKDAVTVGELMRHAAGLPWTSSDKDDSKVDVLPVFDPSTKDYMDKCARVFEASHLNYPEDGSTKTSYHGTTRDLILNELVRRVEGKSLGDFIEEDISGKLGCEFFVGLPPHAEDRVVDHMGVTVAWALLDLGHTIWRYFRGTLTKSPQNVEMLVNEYLEKGNRMGLTRMAETVGLKWHEFLDEHNTPFSRSRESPSSNGVSNAKSMVEIGKILIGLHPELLSEAGRLKALELEPEPVFDSITKSWVHFTRGGFARFGPEWHDLNGFYGWHGLGGQLLLFEPKKQIVLVFLTTSFALTPPWEDTRTRDILRHLKTL